MDEDCWGDLMDSGYVYDMNTGIWSPGSYMVDYGTYYGSINSDDLYLPTTWTGLDSGSSGPGIDFSPTYDPGAIEAASYEQYAAYGGATLVTQWSGTQDGFLVNYCIYDLGHGVQVQATLGRTCPPFLSLGSSIIQGGILLNDNFGGSN